MDSMTLILITILVVSTIVIITTLYLMQSAKNKKYKKLIEKLNIEKNKIESSPINSELSKVESFLKTEKMEVMYNEWKERLQNIKTYQIPKITDMILETEYSLSQMDYRSTQIKIAKLEMEIYKVRTNSEFLLNEIKDITNSEERNRAVITKLRATYRELFQKFTSSKADFGEISNSIELQFENIAKRFEEFEQIMDMNEYTEVTKIIKVIDEMLKHITVVIDEVPTIVLLCNSILPKKIKEVTDAYDKMVREGYPLGYLNIEYNVGEANKKISDIFDRCRILNLEDSIFELKVLLDYFESLFTDFEKERINRKAYEENRDSFTRRLDKLNQLIKDIFSQIDDIKNMYNLSNEDIVLLNGIKKEIKTLNSDYKTLMDHTSNNSFAYSKLSKEIELLVLKLSAIEDRLDNSLDAISSMKADEVRARQQLQEVTSILKESKAKMRDYNLPVVPRSYYIELNEAQAAIKEIVKELDKKPITISALNMRVDTARDLVLKLFSKTKEMLKTAMFAEMAIVYGNRFRSSTEDMDKNLTYSEILFFKGEYKKSLELTINTLNRVEPGIYDKLLNLYGKKSK